jgi:hypothetical protein
LKVLRRSGTPELSGIQWELGETKGGVAFGDDPRNSDAFDDGRNPAGKRKKVRPRSGDLRSDVLNCAVSRQAQTTIMVTKSKLKLALSAEKGVDWQKLQQKKKYKEAERRKRNAASNGGAKVADVEDDTSVGGPDEEQQDKGGAVQNFEEADWEDEVSEGENMGEEEGGDEVGLPSRT